MTAARRLAPAALIAVLALGATACGSSGSSSEGSTKDPEESTTVTAATAERSGADPAEASDGTNPGTETLVDGPADAAHTVTFTEDGTWDPATLQVAPGQVFTFVAAPGAGTHAVTFNGDDTYTISGGLIESFTLSTPGTYTVSEYLSGETMTIVVKG